MPDFKCEFLCPSYHIHQRSEVNTKNVLLPSTKCAPILLEVLNCIYFHEKALAEMSYQYVQGFDHGVYEVTSQFEENDPNTVVIRQRVVDHNNKRVQPVCPNPYENS